MKTFRDSVTNVRSIKKPKQPNQEQQEVVSLIIVKKEKHIWLHWM